MLCPRLVTATDPAASNIFVLGDGLWTGALGVVGWGQMGTRDLDLGSGALELGVEAWGKRVRH